MDTGFHEDGMPEGGTEYFVKIAIILIANSKVIEHLTDAVAQEERGGLSGVVASEIKIRTTGAPGSDAEGVVDAQIAAARRATFKSGTWMCPTPFRIVAGYSHGC